MNDLGLIERSGPWTITVCYECGHVFGSGHEPNCKSAPSMAGKVEVVPAEQLRGAVEALEQITDPECMTRGTGGWIDTDAPARIAQNALDTLRGQ